uniref:Uncharacterized protein n=1 Tax=Poecilia latipinna TaxID=48699 RepID=A0A3B3V215_9TELE
CSSKKQKNKQTNKKKKPYTCKQYDNVQLSYCSGKRRVLCPRGRKRPFDDVLAENHNSSQKKPLLQKQHENPDEFANAVRDKDHHFGDIHCHVTFAFKCYLVSFK